MVVCSTPLWHERLVAEASGRLLVAYTTWETDVLPEESVAVLNHYDRVLVPSQFNAAVFEASGVTAPVIVVPHIARPAQPPRTGPEPTPDPTFAFYLVATWTTRKAILDTVSAFLAAFTAEDRVVMRIHTTPEDQIASARLTGTRSVGRHELATWFTLAKALAGRDRAPKIVLSTRRLTRAEVDELHGESDCFVSLSRGEGWGLGAFDACAHGNPVIVTGWGGRASSCPHAIRTSSATTWCPRWPSSPTRGGYPTRASIGRRRGSPTPRSSCVTSSTIATKPARGDAPSSRRSTRTSPRPR